MKVDEPGEIRATRATTDDHDLPEGLERPSCAICRGHDTVEFQSGNYHLNLIPPLGVVGCRRCGVLFLSPRPNHELRTALMDGRVPELLRPYSEAPANYSAVTDGRTEVFRQRLAYLSSIAPQIEGRPVRLLDVGASSGRLVEHARASGWDAHGVEPSADGVKSAMKSGTQMPRGLAEALPFASNSFDIVHSHHVFEHLADPLIAAREIFRVLRPGGLIFIEVPNQLTNIMFRRDALLNRVPKRERNIRSIHHLWFFSRRTLAALLVRAGFANVQIKDRYSWRPRGLRAPLTLLTQFAGVFFYGGPLVQAVAVKPVAQTET